MEHPLPQLNKLVGVNRVELVKILTKARARIDARIAAILGSSDFARSAAARELAYKQIGGLYANLSREIDQWIKDASTTASMGFLEQVVEDLSHIKGKAKSKKLPLKFSRQYAAKYFEVVSPKNAPSLAATQTNKMANADIRLLRGAVIDSFREASVSGMTMRERQKLIETKIDEATRTKRKTWNFISKDGKKWGKGNYFNMLNRTVTAEVSRQAYTDGLIKSGFDLATIEGGGDPCPVCKRWRGVIVTVSGSSKKHPTIEDARGAGVFHPNCVCELRYIDETEGADAIKTQASTPNPKEPSPEEWSKYASGVKTASKESVSKRSKALQTNLKLDKKIRKN